MGRLYRRQPRLAPGLVVSSSQALGLFEGTGRCDMLGSLISAPTAPRVGSLLIPRLTTLGLSEGGRRCVTLGSSCIGANRASASGLVVSSSQALGLFEVRRRCDKLGSYGIGANRASASGRRLHAWIACFVPPALGLSERKRWYDKLGSSCIGANRASASGLVVSPPQALGLSEVRRRCDKLGSLVSAPTAPRPGRCGFPAPRPFITCGSLFGPARWYGGLVQGRLAQVAGLILPWFYRLGLGPCFLTCFAYSALTATFVACCRLCSLLPPL